MPELIAYSRLILMCFTIAAPAQHAGRVTDHLPHADTTNVMPGESAVALSEGEADSLPVEDSPGTRISADSLHGKDSLLIIPKQAHDTLGDAVSESGPVYAADTSYRFWQKPFWGFGAGWSLGSFPLFDLWKDGLPDSLGSFALPASVVFSRIAGVDTLTDTVAFVYRAREQPDAYSINFPIAVSYTPYAATKQRLSIDATFFFMLKSFVASVQVDTSITLPGTATAFEQLVEYSQRLTLYSFSLGATYKQHISTKYFTITNSDVTSINAGVRVHPLSIVRLKTTADMPGSMPGGYKSVYTLIGTQADGYASDALGFGAGVSWRIGMTSLRRLENASGIEAGIYYAGQWFGYFYDGGERIVRSDINPQAGSAKALTSLSHRFVLEFQLLKGKRPPQIEVASPSPRSTAPSPRKEPVTDETEKADR
ncbi:MAG: hypothetical protein GF398_04670 [Chitinivibrionales bacterium]|nr:hypothetical protein [Chitinivibrionales bacterium]